MLIVIAILAIGWIVLSAMGWSIGGFFARRTPERMARKHPETIDPATGKQRIIADLTDPDDKSTPTPTHSHAGSTRRWIRRGRNHLG